MREPERVVLVGLAKDKSQHQRAEESLEELAQLARTAGAIDVGRFIQIRPTPDPAIYLGKGKAQQVVDEARALRASAIVFDDELAPAQGRNLEDLAGVNPLAADAMKIMDRTGLILEVFAQHAHSIEGKLQVELAQINYLTPRLRGWGDVMSRIGGSRGGVGLGTRGPGETKLEVDRRRIQRRLKKVREELKDVEQSRWTRRKQRMESAVSKVSLVGYTNSGKSTMLNAITGSKVLVENKLFSTLDPTARSVTLPAGRNAVFTDTVGFVRKLPHTLVEAFRSTLEESAEADLLVHVVDASSSDPVGQSRAVEAVLDQINASDVPRLVTLNKIDLVDADVLDDLIVSFEGAVCVSAKTGPGLDELMLKVETTLGEDDLSAELEIPFSADKVRALAHKAGVVVSEVGNDRGTIVAVRGKQAVIADLVRHLREAVT